MKLKKGISIITILFISQFLFFSFIYNDCITDCYVALSQDECTQNTECDKSMPMKQSQTSHSFMKDSHCDSITTKYFFSSPFEMSNSNLIKKDFQLFKIYQYLYTMKMLETFVQACSHQISNIANTALLIKNIRLIC